MHYHFDDIETAERFDAMMTGLEEPGSQRTEAMIRMFMQGNKTNVEIGHCFGISGERVRQIIYRHTGMASRANGPRGQQQEENRQKKIFAKHEKRECNCLRVHGCTLEQKARVPREALHAFQGFRKNAERISGFDCEMTMWEWWCMWAESGLWEVREQKNWVRRIDRSLPYSRQNCFIKD